MSYAAMSDEHFSTRVNLDGGVAGANSTTGFAHGTGKAWSRGTVLMTGTPFLAVFKNLDLSGHVSEVVQR